MRKIALDLDSDYSTVLYQRYIECLETLCKDKGARPLNRLVEIGGLLLVGWTSSFAEDLERKNANNWG